MKKNYPNCSLNSFHYCKWGVISWRMVSSSSCYKKGEPNSRKFANSRPALKQDNQLGNADCVRPWLLGVTALWQDDVKAGNGKSDLITGPKRNGPPLGRRAWNHCIRGKETPLTPHRHLQFLTITCQLLVPQKLSKYIAGWKSLEIRNNIIYYSYLILSNTYFSYILLNRVVILCHSSLHTVTVRTSAHHLLLYRISPTWSGAFLVP